MPSILEETIETASRYNEEMLSSDVSLKEPAITRIKVMCAFNRASSFFNELLKLEEDSGFEVTHIHGRVLDGSDGVVSKLYTNIPTDSPEKDDFFEIRISSNGSISVWDNAVNDILPVFFVSKFLKEKVYDPKEVTNFIKQKAQEKSLIPKMG